MKTYSSPMKTRQELADQWVSHPCLLDGQPAVICGRLCDFATIAQINGSTRAEFSWQSVDRIMLKGGRFNTSTDRF